LNTETQGWIDSHCHLDFEAVQSLDLSPERLRLAGCERILLPAVAIERLMAVLDTQLAFSGLVDVALGLHPYFLDAHEEAHLDALDQAIRAHSPVAIGEVGLDYALPESSWQRQHLFFDAQVELAIHHGLPLVIHCRKAHDEVWSTLRKKRFGEGGIIHGFSGSLQQAKRYRDIGFVLGIGGAVTHERAKAMQKMVKALNDGDFVLETDSPDMAPAFALNQTNTPLNVPKIAQIIADLREQDLADIVRMSSAAYYSIMGRKE